jgi:hypothetical protein
VAWELAGRPLMAAAARWSDRFGGGEREGGGEVAGECAPGGEVERRGEAGQAAGGVVWPARPGEGRRHWR